MLKADRGRCWLLDLEGRNETEGCQVLNHPLWVEEPFDGLKSSRELSHRRRTNLPGRAHRATAWRFEDDCKMCVPVVLHLVVCGRGQTAGISYPGRARPSGPPPDRPNGAGAVRPSESFRGIFGSVVRIQSSSAGESTRPRQVIASLLAAGYRKGAVAYVPKRCYGSY